MTFKAEMYSGARESLGDHVTIAQVNMLQIIDFELPESPTH
jgi:hypothetical protein